MTDNDKKFYCGRIHKRVTGPECELCWEGRIISAKLNKRTTPYASCNLCRKANERRVVHGG